MKNNYNFDVVKLHLKFNQRTISTLHKFQIRFPSQNLILFQPSLCLKEGMRLKMDITIDVDNYKLNVRAACIITHNNKVLVHRNINSDHYALIGGRVEIGEDSETTIKREVKEEIGKEIEITGYIATIENFFEMKGSKYHEYMFIYQAEFKEEQDRKIEETLKNVEGKEYLQYEWLELKKIEEYSILPKVVKEILREEKYPVHIVNVDN